MHLRNSNIIVCDGCGAEKNPEITLDIDFVKHSAETNIATCSNCGDSGEIILPSTEPPIDEPVI
jgi:transcription elongation factor Elf1